MEHDERDDNLDNIEEVLESLTSDSGDFENFLSRKAEECASKSQGDIINDLKLIPINDRPAPGVAAKSSNGTSSSDVNDDSKLHENVPGAVNEQETKLTLHNHPIVGSYTTETSQPITYDDELKHIYFETIRVSVAEQTAEEIVERFHKLERAVQMIRMQQQGLRVSLEEVLKARTWKDREAIMELDRKHRAKVNKKQADKIAKGGDKKSSGMAVAGRAKTKAMKTADTFKSLMMSREATIEKLKSLNIWDDVVEVYVTKIFG